MQTSRPSLPWFWLALVLSCAAAYLYGLGSSYAPTNGDEMVYIHIARMTAESGHWLPLQSEIIGTRNTKPPLLFWQAMVAGQWGTSWSLWQLRLPSIAYTFATTGLLMFFTFQIKLPSRDAWRDACLAGAVYLLFFSTFRYGRVYLTSAPETFWLTLPLWWVLWKRLQSGSSEGSASQPETWGAVTYTLFGVAFGLGAAYKSFALIAPAAAAIWCAILFSGPRLTWPQAIRTSAGLGWSTLIGLAIFALWFVLDPDPSSVWQEFIVAENAGKMSNSQGYWHAALFGAYPMWTQLLAYPENAGLLFFLPAGLAWAFAPQVFQRTTYRQLAPYQWVLIAWLVIWLVIFTIPSQRSARYVIPAMPALAMIIALCWERIGKLWFYITLAIAVPALLMLARIGWVMGEMQIASPFQVAIVLIATGAGFTWTMAGFCIKNGVKTASLVSVLAIYVSFSAMVQPLSTSQSEYPEDVVLTVKNSRIAVPNGFTGQYERFHFVLPGTRISPYDAEGRNTGAFKPELPGPQRLNYLLNEFDAVVWLQTDLNQATAGCEPSCTMLGSRWHVKSRHKSGEITLNNLWYPDQWLFRKEWLLIPKRH
jgi:4-amino-4-deoxy-L-arabinose transferase-like glycosyltransferase